MTPNPQALLDALDGVALLLDSQLRITHIGWPNWDRFWRANGGGSARFDPRGDDITDYISEGPLRDSFRLMFHQVLLGESGQVRMGYRCDAPHLRRLMRLTVTAVGSGGPGRQLLYQSVLLSEAPRPPVPLIDTPPSRYTSEGATRLCPGCNRTWSPAALPVDNLDWAEPPAGSLDEAPEVVHEFCMRCYLALIEPTA